MNIANLTKEISIETPNTMGTAAKLTNLVSKQAKANIRAAWAEGHGNKGHFSLITDNNQKVMETLRKDFPQMQEHEVIVLSVKNTLGSIADVTNQLSQAGIDINYLFTTTYEDKPVLVLSTNDNKKAMSIFNK